ncbi:MAG: serine phosphatase RsbU (regulator of sigma subunit) [Marinoscillum sp.]|jgi:serine phosphatase RsbU (regulator of sigma subunit)
MNNQQFINTLKSNFNNILDVGIIVDGELQDFVHASDVNQEDLEGLVMRLYFLSLDPEKKINFFVNQYQDEKFLYFIKLEEGKWLFILCADDNFATLHFYIKYLLEDIKSNKFLQDSDQDRLKLQSARRIQNLLFPNITKGLSQYKKHQLFYNPKDTVGGDFYWFRNNPQHDWIVVGDCTGHSVEGALGSVSVMSILNQVFDPTMDPHLLIKALHEGLNDIQLLDVNSGYGIGCEIMVIKIDRKKKLLKYSSNGMPFYLLGDKVKKSKTKTSSFEPEKVIKFIRSRTVQLENEEAFFVHSDGLTDQINDFGKRFKSRKLSDTLSSLDKGHPQAVATAFLEWKGEQEQTDDVVYLYVQP